MGSIHPNGFIVAHINKHVVIMWKRWRGDILKRLTEQSASKAVNRASEATLEVALNQVPLDEGTLSESGIVRKNPSDLLEYAVSFGGGGNTGFPKVPYAVKWHETPANFQHGRKHNYLRDPIKTFAPGAVNKELKKELAKTWS